MKKKVSALLAVLMVFAMAIVVVGCGSKPTLEKWYSDNKSQFDEIVDAANQTASVTGVKMDITVDGSALVFNYTLVDEFPTDPDSLTALSNLYDDQFDTMKSMFSELASQMQDETSTENVSIRLAVFNPDGTELYSRDFTQ